jgi:hypothetical protein
MLRTTLAAIALLALSGAAYAVDDATSENDAIQLDEGKQPYSPGSSMERAPNTLPDTGEAREMEESDVINN